MMMRMKQLNKASSHQTSFLFSSFSPNIKREEIYFHPEQREGNTSSTVAKKEKEIREKKREERVRERERERRFFSLFCVCSTVILIGTTKR